MKIHDIAEASELVKRRSDFLDRARKAQLPDRYSICELSREGHNREIVIVTNQPRKTDPAQNLYEAIKLELAKYFSAQVEEIEDRMRELGVDISSH